MWTPAASKQGDGMSMDGDSRSAPVAWRKSLHSVGNGECVEIAAADGAVMVRDSLDRAGSALRCSERAWRAFTAAARTGAFDGLS